MPAPRKWSEVAATPPSIGQFLMGMDEDETVVTKNEFVALLLLAALEVWTQEDDGGEQVTTVMKFGGGIDGVPLFFDWSTENVCVIRKQTGEAFLTIDLDNEEIVIGDPAYSVKSNGNFWQVFTNEILIAQADEDGWQFKVPFTVPNRELGNGDPSEVTAADGVVLYTRTDSADLVMPSGGAMQSTQEVTVFNQSADPVELTELVGNGFWFQGTVGDTLVLSSGASATFIAVNKPGLGGVLGVKCETGLNFPE